MGIALGASPFSISGNLGRKRNFYCQDNFWQVVILYISLGEIGECSWRRPSQGHRSQPEGGERSEGYSQSFHGDSEGISRVDDIC